MPSSSPDATSDTAQGDETHSAPDTAPNAAPDTTPQTGPDTLAGTPLPEPGRLAEEVAALRAEVGRLNAQRFFRMETSFWQIASWSVLRGLFFGLGSVLGASILLSFFVQMLSSMDFIPVIGDWAQQLIDEIQTNKTR